LSGSAFGQGKTITLPAGNIDITPTVLDLLGLEAPAGIDGRVLREAFRNGSTDAAMPEASEHTYSSTNSTGPITHLSVTQVSMPQAGATRYFNKAWVA
jgi:arylsulfatase A-like enzyme